MPQDRTSYIEGLYQNVLKRAPDAEGMDFWANSDLSEDALKRAFSGSVEGLYQGVLGRAPDQGGWDYWNNSGVAPDDMWRIFYQSQEASRPRVEDMYTQILGRKADSAGADHYSSLGLSDAEIAKILHNSQEGAARRAPQKDQQDVFKPGYLYEGNNFYGKPPAAEWMQAGRSAGEGINRMPGVFSDYGALSSMPGNLAHNMFYPKGTGNMFETTAGIGRGGAPQQGAEDSNYNNLAAMFGQLSETNRQSLLAMLLGDQQQHMDPEH
jgi:hypothetical protein